MFQFSLNENLNICIHVYKKNLKISILCNCTDISIQFTGTIFKKCVNHAYTQIEYRLINLVKLYVFAVQ